jgi:hypothetical protein
MLKAMTNHDHKPNDCERRGPDRTAEEDSWEAKVLGRLSRRVSEALEPAAPGESRDLGWEQKSLELLRSRLKRTSE